MHVVKKATLILFILLNAIKKGMTESFIYYLSNFTNFAGSVEFNLKEFWVFVGPNIVLKSNFQNKLYLCINNICALGDSKASAW